MADKVVVVGSKRGSMSGTDWKSMLVSLGIGTAGTILTYLTAWVAGASESQLFGMWTPIIVSAWGVASAFLRKLLTDRSNVTTTTVTK